MSSDNMLVVVLLVNAVCMLFFYVCGWNMMLSLEMLMLLPTWNSCHNFQVVQIVGDDREDEMQMRCIVLVNCVSQPVFWQSGIGFDDRCQWSNVQDLQTAWCFCWYNPCNRINTHIDYSFINSSAVTGPQLGKHTNTQPSGKLNSNNLDHEISKNGTNTAFEKSSRQQGRWYNHSTSCTSSSSACDCCLKGKEEGSRSEFSGWCVPLVVCWKVIHKKCEVDGESNEPI